MQKAKKIMFTVLLILFLGGIISLVLAKYINTDSEDIAPEKSTLYFIDGKEDRMLP